MFSPASSDARISSGPMVKSRMRTSGVRPLADLVAVGDGHAHHLGDHREREREGEVGDEVHLAPVGGGVEVLVDEPARPAAAGRRCASG